MTRGLRQDGQREKSDSDVVRQSRQSAGIVQTKGCNMDNLSLPDPKRSRFHGAKLALFIGDDLAVILRDDISEIPWPGCWDFPGGGREDAESPEECVLRETREELGLTLTQNDLVWSRQYPMGNRVFWFFVTHMPAEVIKDVSLGDEGQDWALMSPETYLGHDKAIPQFQSRLSDYLDEVAASHRSSP